MVRYFGPPKGAVPEGLPFDRLRGLFPVPMDRWVDGAGKVASKFAETKEGELIEALIRLQSENSANFEGWLEKVGLVHSGRVSIAVLSGQVLATVVSLAQEDDDDDKRSILDRIAALDWWFYPLCRIIT